MRLHALASLRSRSSKVSVGAAPATDYSSEDLATIILPIIGGVVVGATLVSVYDGSKKNDAIDRLNKIDARYVARANAARDEAANTHDHAFYLGRSFGARDAVAVLRGKDATWRVAGESPEFLSAFDALSKP